MTTHTHTGDALVDLTHKPPLTIHPHDITQAVVTDRGCEVCGQWTANTITNGRRVHTRCLPPPDPAPADQVAAGCTAAQRRLRWEYTVAYRRRLRLPGVYPNQQQADRSACEHLRHHTPIVLAHHLPGIELVEWIDPNPAVTDSSWTLPGWDIDLYWDYHPNWTIGDATALTIWHQPTNPENGAQ